MEEYPLYKGNVFAVSPQGMRFSMDAGESRSGTLMITNPVDAENELHYKVTVVPYNVVGEEYDIDLENMTEYSKIVDWVQIENPEGMIAKNSVHTVNYTINVPEDAPGGGQYFAFLVQNVADEHSSSDTVRVKDVMELSSIVYVSVNGDIIYKGEVLDSEVPAFSFSNPFTTSTLVRNDGNIHRDALIKVKATNVFTGEEMNIWNAAEEGKTGEDESVEATISYVIMPGTTRYTSMQVAGLPDLGIYNVKQVVSFEEKEYITEQTMILCPLWFVGLVFLAILSVVGMVVRRVKTRKRRRRKF